MTNSHATLTVLLAVVAVMSIDASGSAVSYCDYPIVARMMRELGMRPARASCPVKNKRAFAMLVDSVLENRKRQVSERENTDSDAYQELRRAFGAHDGQFCCSPSCDRFAAQMSLTPSTMSC